MAVNHFSIMSLGRANLMDPHSVGFQDAVDILHDTFHRTRKDFVKIGFYLKHIRDKELYLEVGYKNINEFAFDTFKLSQPSTSRYINICEQFSSGGNSPELDERFESYNVSQLIEMVSIKEPELIEQISSDMSAQKIREFKKTSKEQKEDHEDMIPGQTSIENDFPEYMPNDVYATSHKSDQEEIEDPMDSVKGEQIIDGEYREISSECVEIKDSSRIDQCNEEQDDVAQVSPSIPLIEQKQEETTFPTLKNAEERKKWLQNYKDWRLWYRDENIDVNYYKYDFPDGSRLICCEYPMRDHEWGERRMDEVHFHLLEKDKPKYGGKKTYDQKFCHSTTSETYLIEFLKRFK